MYTGIYNTVQYPRVYLGYIPPGNLLPHLGTSLPSCLGHPSHHRWVYRPSSLLGVPFLITAGYCSHRYTAGCCSSLITAGCCSSLITAGCCTALLHRWVLYRTVTPLWKSLETPLNQVLSSGTGLGGQERHFEVGNSFPFTRFTGRH